MDTKEILAVATTHTECEKQKKKKKGREHNRSVRTSSAMAPLSKKKRRPNMTGKEKAPRKQNTFCTLNNASTALYTKHGLFLYNATDLYQEAENLFLSSISFSHLSALCRNQARHTMLNTDCSSSRLLKQQNFGKWRDDPTRRLIGVYC